MMKRCTVHQVSLVLLVIGGLNWGLVGLGGWNVVNMLLGGVPVVERVVYVLVGLAAVAVLSDGKCKTCRVGG